MKKFILSAAAVAAFAVGGAAQADIIDGVGNTISQIFGVPYDPRPPAPAPIVNVYTDVQGRHFQVDASGRQWPLDRFGSYHDQWGRTVYLNAESKPFYMEQNGRLVPYNASNAYASRSNDRDGDGVPNRRDRSPNDPRYR